MNVNADKKRLERAQERHDVFAEAEARERLEESKRQFAEEQAKQREKLKEFTSSDRFKMYRQMRGLTRYVDYMLRMYKDNELPENVADSIQEANRRILEN